MGEERILTLHQYESRRIDPTTNETDSCSFVEFISIHLDFLLYSAVNFQNGRTHIKPL